MSDLFVSDDEFALQDEGYSVSAVVQPDDQRGVHLSITDVESIHEWTGQWLKQNEAGRRARA